MPDCSSPSSSLPGDTFPVRRAIPRAGDTLEKSPALFPLPSLCQSTTGPWEGLSGGEVFTPNKKCLLKDLAVGNPWNSEPPPPVGGPALDAPQGR